MRPAICWRAISLAAAAGCPAFARRRRRVGPAELLDRSLQLVDAVGELLLLAREPPPGVPVRGVRALRQPRRLAGDAALLLGDLLRFEARLARGLLPRVRVVAAHLLLEPAQLSRGPLTALGGG